MSRRWQRRVRQRTQAQSKHGQRARRSGARDLVGRDVARVRLGDPRRAWLTFIAVAVPLALGIASLRVDVIRLRYALAETERSERQLAESRRTLVGEARSLRHPERLATEARRLNFGPARVVRLGAVIPEAEPPKRGASEFASLRTRDGSGARP